MIQEGKSGDRDIGASGNRNIGTSGHIRNINKISGCHSDRAKQILAILAITKGTIKLLHGAQYSEDREQITIDLESFVVRRAVCQLTAKSYNRLVVEMIKELRGANDFSAKAIRQFLLQQTAESTRWPTNEEFSEAWRSLELYKRMKRSKLRMILEGLDLASRTKLTEQITIEDKLTIEHVMPRERKEHWPLLVKDGNGNAMETLEKRRNGLIHRIGNLTLLTKTLNPTVSNSAWEKKRDAIVKHSVLSLNREFQQYAAWNEDEIEKWTERLLRLALGIWPRPASAPPLPESV